MRACSIVTNGAASTIAEPSARELRYGVLPLGGKECATNQKRLTIVSEPAPGTKAVIDRRSETTIVYRGHENDTAYVCGSCAAPLIVGVDVRKFHGVVIKCNHCKSFNAVDGSRRP